MLWYLVASAFWYQLEEEEVEDKENEEYESDEAAEDDWDDEM